jgi:uncharacterized protein GlcG (DUF336 family)
MSDTFEKKSITSKTCKKMIDAAEIKASRLNLGISISIVDESGIQKAFSRMDTAPLISIKASLKKALTAVGMGMPSGQSWFDFIKDDPILREGVHDFDDFILLGGGSPIILEGKVVGGIGVSGGHYKQDEECVKAAMNVLEIMNE